MLNDLDFITDNKRKKSRKKRKSKSKKKHLLSSKSNNSKSSLNSKNNNNISTSKNKEIRYPKPSKRSPSFSEIKKENVSNLSNYKDLKKSWRTTNKKKSNSVIKYPKKENGKIIGDEEFSKKTILTLINDNKNIIKENLDKIGINKASENNEKFLGLNSTNNGKENNANDNKIYKDYLFVNLHKVNRRRTINDEDKKQTKASIIDIISNSKLKNRKESKSLLLPDNKIEIKSNENTDENIVQDFKDKTPII